MTILFESVDRNSYLVATISDTTLCTQRAKSILNAIGSECQKSGYCKALLNELTLEKRNIANHEIRGLSEHMPDIYLACLCKPELIDNTSKLFSAFTFTNRYTVKYFSIESEAVTWLRSMPGN
ncbi:MAG TPA: hypothetical protein VIS57_02120 [Xanthomonadales bacterium]